MAQICIPIGRDGCCSPIGNPEWSEQSVYDDDYTFPEEPEQDEMSPLDDDYIREEYR